MTNQAQYPAPKPAITVLWQPEAGAPFEPLCDCDGTDDDEQALLADAMANAPEGAAARIERGSDSWRLILQDPPED